MRVWAGILSRTATLGVKAPAPGVVSLGLGFGLSLGLALALTTLAATVIGLTTTTRGRTLHLGEVSGRDLLVEGSAIFGSFGTRRRARDVMSGVKEPTDLLFTTTEARGCRVSGGLSLCLSSIRRSGLSS